MNKNKTLLQKFMEFNATKRMSSAKKKTLLTVSGGVDSVVMCDLFYKAGFPFAIAHCNFQLRGDESDADEKFVKDLGKKYNVEVYTIKFDTGKYAAEKKISTQLAARELRYEWFEKLRTDNDFQLIATAHHLNDNIETIIYNLAKGTGIRGLRGIPVRQGNIVRPILFASREEIETFQKEQGLEFREDSSNQSDKYSRNKIRHHIIPLLKEINPSLENTFAEKIDLFTELEELYEKKIKQASTQLFLQRKADIYIPILKLKKTHNASSVLYEYLKDFDFTVEQVEDMLHSMDSMSGKQFLTSKARIIKDRRFFILTKLPERDFTIKLLQREDAEIDLGEGKLVLTQAAIRDPKSEIISAPNIALVDSAKLEFPLTVRRWKEGDYFYPIGMKMKKKKLKKFFTDAKVPLNEKENCWIIESGGRIVWVVGHRLDERFKVTPHTTNALKIRFQ